MNFYGPQICFPYLLWIFLLHQVTKTLTNPISNHPGRPEAQDYVTNPKNLSEIIEYEPFNFPEEISNISVIREVDEQNGERKISTFRLKTFLHVEDNQNASSREKRQRKTESRAVDESAQNGKDSVGLSLDRQSWNKRMFVRGKVEPNETRSSLDDLEYVPGEVMSHVSEMLTRVSHTDVKDPHGGNPLREKQVGISLEDGTVRKRPYFRGKVERNETKATLRDIQYMPGDIRGMLYRMWLDSGEQVKTEFRSSEDERIESTEGVDSIESDPRKSSRVRSGTGYMHDEHSPDKLETAESYWFGKGKIEKLHYSNGKQAWKKFPEELNISVTKRLSQRKAAASDRQARGVSYNLPKNNIPDVSGSDEVTESIEFPYDSQENLVANDRRRQGSARSRQFVFHPYLPYGKDVPADEKIKFSDILPIRMVKFVKSMVEEAPWEQMFIKMVRMVVDQFVDKIIEKMFADKGDEHAKKRSIDFFLGDSWGLVATPVIRVRRAVDAKTQQHQMDDWSSSVPSKRYPQQFAEEKKGEDENKSWLDHFLDFVFPNSKSEGLDASDFGRLKKRDADNAHLFRVIVSYFVNYFEKTSEALTDAKDALRYKMLKDILPYLYQKKFLKHRTFESSPNSVESLAMAPRGVVEQIKDSNELEDLSARKARSKRSTEDGGRKKDELRLWQEGSRKHKPHHRRLRDDCSLRRACNTGRFLSRLPAVEEITLQLKSQGNEPHWDAMIWGMKKKRCSRIFCKRQRSPKGSRHSWFEDRDRPSRKLEIVTDLPNDMDGASNLAS